LAQGIPVTKSHRHLSTMPERRDGDWDCPDCGALVFASKESCFKCGGGGSRQSSTGGRAGDWTCPSCGEMVFASKSSCFKCGASKGSGASGGGTDRSSGGGRAGDWTCPGCGENVFASKSSCFKCGATKESRGSGSAGASSAPAKDPVKELAKMSATFKKSWVSYCKLYGQGFTDPAKYDRAFVKEFLEYVGGIVNAELAKETPPEDTPAPEPEPAPPAPTKRPAVKLSAAAQPTAKVAKTAPDKLTIRKSVADEIRRLNASGLLAQDIRPGAVARSLSQIDEAGALGILALLEAEVDEVPDPNVYVKEQAQSMIPEE